MAISTIHGIDLVIGYAAATHLAEDAMRASCPSRRTCLVARAARRRYRYELSIPGMAKTTATWRTPVPSALVESGA